MHVYSLPAIYFGEVLHQFLVQLLKAGNLIQTMTNSQCQWHHLKFTFKPSFKECAHPCTFIYAYRHHAFSLEYHQCNSSKNQYDWQTTLKRSLDQKGYYRTSRPSSPPSFCHMGAFSRSSGVCPSLSKQITVLFNTIPPFKKIDKPQDEHEVLGGGGWYWPQSAAFWREGNYCIIRHTKTNTLTFKRKRF